MILPEFSQIDFNQLFIKKVWLKIEYQKNQILYVNKLLYLNFSICKITLFKYDLSTIQLNLLMV